MNFEELAEYHVEQDADLTIATIPVNAHDAPGFGIMKVNEQAMIESFIEKPQPDVLSEWQSAVSDDLRAEGKIYLASMGIYIFKKEVLHGLLDEDPDAIDFGKEIIPAAINSGMREASFAFNGYWTDIGTISSFFDANIALTDAVPQFNLFDNVKYIYTRPRMLAPSKVFGTWFNQAILADGCIINAKKIERAIIGIRSRIGNNTEISKGVIMGNDFYETIEDITRHEGIPMGIGENCHIENAITDKNCRIGNDVIIRGGNSLENTETDTYCIRDGIVVVKKGAVIPHGSRIGEV